MAYNKYNIRDVSKMTYKELTKLARPLRTAARERLARLQKFDPESELAAKYKQLLAIDLRGGRAAKEQAIIYASRYLNLRRSSVAGEKSYRRKMRQSLLNADRHPPIDIPTRDIRKFGQFMEAARAIGLDELYGSDDVALQARNSGYDIEKSKAFNDALDQDYKKYMAAYQAWKDR